MANDIGLAQSFKTKKADKVYKSKRKGVFKKKRVK